MDKQQHDVSLLKATITEQEHLLSRLIGEIKTKDKKQSLVDEELQDLKLSALKLQSSNDELVNETQGLRKHVEKTNSTVTDLQTRLDAAIVDLETLQGEHKSLQKHHLQVLQESRDLTDERQALEEKTHDLVKKVEDFQIKEETYAKLEIQLSNSKAHENTLLKQIEFLEQNLENANSAVNVVKAEFSQLNEHLQKVLEEKELLAKELHNTIKEMESQENEYWIVISSKDDKLESLQQAHEELFVDQSKLLDDLTKLRLSLNSLDEENRYCKEIILQLEEVETERNEQIARLFSSNKNVTKKNEILETDLGEKQAAIDQLISSRKEDDENLKKFRALHQTVVDDFSNLQQNLELVTQNVEDLSAEKEQLVTENKNLHEKLASALVSHSSIVEMKEEISLLTNSNSVLLSDLSCLQNQIEEVNSQNMLLNESIANFKTLVSSLNEQLESERLKHEETVHTLDTVLTETKESKSMLTSEFTSLKFSLEAAINENQIACELSDSRLNTINDYKRQVDDFNVQLNKAFQANLILQNEMNQLKDENDKVQETLKINRAKLFQQTTENAKTEFALKELERNLTDARKSLQDKENLVTAFECDLKLLKQNLDSKSSEIAQLADTNERNLWLLAEKLSESEEEKSRLQIQLIKSNRELSIANNTTMDFAVQNNCMMKKLTEQEAESRKELLQLVIAYSDMQSDLHTKIEEVQSKNSYFTNTMVELDSIISSLNKQLCDEEVRLNNCHSTSLDIVNLPKNKSAMKIGAVKHEKIDTSKIQESDEVTADRIALAKMCRQHVEKLIVKFCKVQQNCQSYQAELIEASRIKQELNVEVTQLQLRLSEKNAKVIELEAINTKTVDNFKNLNEKFEDACKNLEMKEKQIIKFQNEIVILQKSNNDKTNAITDIKVEHEKKELLFREKLCKAKEQICFKQCELAQSCKNFEATHQLTEKMQHENSKMKKEISEMKIAHSKKLSQIENSNSELQLHLAALKIQKQEVDVHNDSLLKCMTKFEADISTLTVQLESAKLHQNKAENALLSAEQYSCTRESEIKKLKLLLETCNKNKDNSDKVSDFRLSLINEFKQKLEESATKQTTAEKAVLSTLADLQEANKKIDEQNNYIADLQRDVKEQTAQNKLLSTAIDQSDCDLKKLSNQLTEITLKLESKEEQIDRLKNEITTLQKTKYAFANEIEDQKKTLSLLSKQLNILAEEKKKIQSELAQSCQKLKTAHAKIDMLQVQEKDTNKRVNALEDEYRKITNKLEAIQVDVATKDKMIATMKFAVIPDLESQLAKKARSLDHSESRILKMEQEIVLLLSDKDKFIIEKSSMVSNISMLSMQLEHKDVDIDTLKATVQNLRDNNQCLATKLQRLEKDLAKEIESKTKLQAALNKSTAYDLEKTQQLAALTIDLNAIKKDNQTLSESLEEMSDEKQLTEEILTSKNNLVEEKVKCINNLQKKLSFAYQAVEKLKKKVTCTEQDCEELHSSIIFLRKINEDTQLKVENLEALYNRISLDNASLREENKNLINESLLAAQTVIQLEKQLVESEEKIKKTVDRNEAFNNLTLEVQILAYANIKLLEDVGNACCKLNGKKRECKYVNKYLKKLSNENRQLQHESSESETKLGILLKAVSKHETLWADQNCQIEILQKEIESVLTSYKCLVKEHSFLQLKLIDRDKACENLKIILACADTEFQNFHNEVRKIVTEKDSLKVLVAEKENVIKNLQIKNEQLNGSNRKLQKLTKDFEESELNHINVTLLLNREVSCLKQQLTDVIDQCQILSNSLNVTEIDIISLNTKLSSSLVENRRLKNDLNSREQKLEAFAQHLENMSVKLKTAESVIEIKNNEMNKLCHEIVIVHDQNSCTVESSQLIQNQLQQNVVTLKTTIEKLTTELNQKTQFCEKLLDDKTLSELKKKEDTFKNTKNLHNKPIKLLSSECDAMNVKIACLTKAIGTHMNQDKLNNATIIENKKQIESLLCDKRSLLSKLNDSATENSMLQKQVHEFSIKLIESHQKYKIQEDKYQHLCDEVNTIQIKNKQLGFYADQIADQNSNLHVQIAQISDKFHLSEIEQIKLKSEVSKNKFTIMELKKQLENNSIESASKKALLKMKMESLNDEMALLKAQNQEAVNFLYLNIDDLKKHRNALKDELIKAKHQIEAKDHKILELEESQKDACLKLEKVMQKHQELRVNSKELKETLNFKDFELKCVLDTIPSRDSRIKELHHTYSVLEQSYINDFKEKNLKIINMHKDMVKLQLEVQNASCSISVAEEYGAVRETVIKMQYETVRNLEQQLLGKKNTLTEYEAKIKLMTKNEIILIEENKELSCQRKKMSMEIDKLTAELGLFQKDHATKTKELKEEIVHYCEQSDAWNQQEEMLLSKLSW